MRLIALNCNHCGAPLDVPEEANFVTCSFCETRLRVERTETTFSTTVLEEIKSTTNELSREVRHMRLQNELDRLHSDWQRDRVRLLKRTKNGNFIAPTIGQGNLIRILAVIACGIGVIASVVSWHFVPAIFGVVFGFICNLVGLAAINDARIYNSARSAVRRREAIIVSEMNSL